MPTSSYGATPNYACNAGDSLSGSTCTHTASNSYAATVSYSCNSGDSLSGSTCTHTSTASPTANYSCSSGTLSGSQCLGAKRRTAYVYLGGKEIAETSEGTTQYVHTDGLGSPVAHTNASATLLNRSRFEPYGYVAAGTKPSPGTSVVGFTGHVQDAETDLVYMQQRYYDPIAGRFLSVDPVVTDANTGKSFGLYTYVDNNPYAKIDPDGREPKIGECGWAQSQCAVYGGDGSGGSKAPRAAPPSLSVGAPGGTPASDGDIDELMAKLNETLISMGPPGMVVAAPIRGMIALDARIVGAEAGAIRAVNMVGGRLNCVNCVIATDALLAGRPASALGGGPFRIGVLEQFYGTKFGPAGTIDSIRSAMAAAGAGARGIVFGSRGSAVGHVFNVVNQRGVVRFIDGQTGGVANLEGFQNFQLLRTN